MKKCREHTKGVYSIMKILTRTQYKEMCKLIVTQREAIRLLEEQCDLLKKILKKTNLSSLYGKTALHDIDFPNSHPAVEPDTRDQWR